MSFARTFFKVILTILLVLSILLTVFSLSLFQFTSSSHLKPSATALVEQEISQVYNELTPEEIDDARNEVITSCQGKETAIISLTTAKASNNLISEVEINCSGINNQTLTEEIIRIVSEGITNSVYEKQYDCEFTACIAENPLVIASQKANDYFKTYVIISVILSLLLILGVILLSKPKFTCFYNFASGFLISGSLFVIKFFVPNLIGKITIPDFAINQIDYFVNSLFINFLIVFILGTIFLVLGIILKTKNSDKNKK